METEERIKYKARFFYLKQHRAHVKTKPVGSFDCFFLSDLIDDAYYEIQKINPFTGERLEDGYDKLFLIDIFDIKIFERRVEG